MEEFEPTKQDFLKVNAHCNLLLSENNIVILQYSLNYFKLIWIIPTCLSISIWNLSQKNKQVFTIMSKAIDPLGRSGQGSITHLHTHVCLNVCPHVHLSIHTFQNLTKTKQFQGKIVISTLLTATVRPARVDHLWHPILLYSFQEFTEQDYKVLIDGWTLKIRCCKDGNLGWGQIQAFKEEY